MKVWGFAMRSGQFTFLIVACFLVIAVAVYAAEESVKVTVSIVPQKYFVEKIGGEYVDVSVMVPPGSFPGTYEPKPQQMVSLENSHVYFAIGVPFENAWLERFRSANPDMTIVHTDKGIHKRSFTGQESGDEHKTDTAGHSHDDTGTDPHIWLSPPLVKVQAKHIRDTLVKIDPSHETYYDNDYEQFKNEVDTLHRTLQKKFAEVEAGTPFMVFHPSWGYFADEYGLRQIPVEVEGKEPGPRDLSRLISIAESQNITVIFVQPQISTKNARVIANAIKGKVIKADPLTYEWKENLLDVAQKIYGAIK